jgi:hypothetical protein
MEPEGLSPHSQEPATCPYPEPDQSSPRPPTQPLEDPFSVLLIREWNTFYLIHDIKFCWACRRRDKHILNLDSRWQRKVTFPYRLFCSRRTKSVRTEYVSKWAPELVRTFRGGGGECPCIRFSYMEITGLQFKSGNRKTLQLLYLNFLISTGKYRYCIVPCYRPQCLLFRIIYICKSLNNI